MGAASLLLHPLTQLHLPRIVLEGAPGQGKSTIAQYVAQVHRMRLLEKHGQLTELPDSHRAAPVRLPFKVDLRDLASWLTRRDPFSGEPIPLESAGWQKSLESFLAALVRHHSGGAAFDVSDLHAVAKHSSLLLILDGLDEVADITRRKDVVEEIERGSKRLSEVAASLQVIVTSRPAVFANSPGLPESRFFYCQLGAVTRPLIDEYADKWLRARRLQGKDRAEVKAVLAEKLDQPHLRDLARNPMQLAILLSLIHTRGSSLPDKRTALYDTYLELFFSREAEKSAVVRENRDLLVDIHRFVAWILHSEAEVEGSNGSINRDRLELLLGDYLRREGHDPSVVQRLFTGMVERVGALVSRVEGTLEFEVQPLREYFAARYLYETAPYSPPGNERKGTKPDRFDALARDFYWSNVARFYAGCFSKGELPSLVDRLNELTSAEGFAETSHPRVLAATLLSDWVFAQHPRSVRDIVALVLDGIGLRFLTSSIQRRVRGGTPLVLPSRSGRDELIERCFAILLADPPADYVLDIVDVLKANATSAEIFEGWRSRAGARTGQAKTSWLQYGVMTGSLARVPEPELESLVGATSDTTDLVAVLQAGRWSYVENDPRLKDLAVEAILDGAYQDRPRVRRSGTVLERFASAVAPIRYAIALWGPEPVPLSDLWMRRYIGSDLRAVASRTELQDPLLIDCDLFADLADRESRKLARAWATELASWDAIVEALRGIRGDRWIVAQLGNIAAGIKSTSETCTQYSELFDSGAPLCRRLRYARLRAGTPTWWERHVDRAESESQQMLLCLSLLTWGSAMTLRQIAPRIQQMADSLTQAAWDQLVRALQGIPVQLIPLVGKKEDLVWLVAVSKSAGPRVATLLSLRGDTEVRRELYATCLQRYDGEDQAVLETCQAAAIDMLVSGLGDPDRHLSVIARSYAMGATSGDYSFERFVRRHATPELSHAVARSIVRQAERYPGYLVAVAERVCQAEVAKSVVPVGLVAERERWVFV